MSDWRKQREVHKAMGLICDYIDKHIPDPDRAYIEKGMLMVQDHLMAIWDKEVKEDEEKYHLGHEPQMGTYDH